jgi:hypothetical protein
MQIILPPAVEFRKVSLGDTCWWYSGGSKILVLKIQEVMTQEYGLCNGLILGSCGLVAVPSTEKVEVVSSRLVVGHEPVQSQ